MVQEFDVVDLQIFKLIISPSPRSSRKKPGESVFQDKMKNNLGSNFPIYHKHTVICWCSTVLQNFKKFLTEDL